MPASSIALNPITKAVFERLIEDLYHTPDDVVAKVRTCWHRHSG